MTQLLQVLREVLRERTADTSLVARIINTTARLAPKLRHVPYSELENLITEVFRLCHDFPAEQGSYQLFVSAAILARVDDLSTFLWHIRRRVHPTGWIFSALEFVEWQWREPPDADNAPAWDGRTTLAVRSLLQLSAYTDSSCLAQQPALRGIQMFSQALSLPGDISLVAYLTMCQAPHWFHNPALQPVLQNTSVWSRLGKVALEYPQFATDYIRLGMDIANVSEWKPFIHADLVTWIKVFMGIPNVSDPMETMFITVVRSIWVPDLTYQEQSVDDLNKSWFLTMAALSNAWKTWQISLPPPEFMRLARSTVLTTLRVNYFLSEEVPAIFRYKPILHDLRAACSDRLGSALIQAASNARHTVSSTMSLRDTDTPPALVVDHITGFLKVLGEKISTEFESTGGVVSLGGIMQSYANWGELETLFQADLEELLGVLVH
ncbi:hypothetical protein DFH06DRAFT_1472613 [Mycena polygramma]|nr:hypothetical protein DFH06DRAFT_1472613 [Mycena polygramma]